ncbi:type VI secretion system tube protein TssD [Chitinophaga sp. MM2321]|uniref:type VI secretion system tube protein TssD n=1 Tax=Chitinophaga sp. MM2321 TaxID=3137178 RepID=UPI0032D588DA
MSFKATISINGEEMNVLECQFVFTQTTDHNGKPATRPQGGIVAVVVESGGDTHLFDWMISNTQTKSGCITFLRRDALSRLKELHFKDAYCIEYAEHFKASGEQPMQIRIKLSARELVLNQSAYQNPWPL